MFTTLSACTTVLCSITNPVISTDPRCYPFIGVKAVKAELEGNGEYRLAAFMALYHLQTSQEQAARDTADRNKRGFMSSHAWHGSRIAEMVIAGKDLTSEDQARVDGFAVRYSKQISVLLRTAAMAAHPELAVSARQFSVT